MEIDCVFREVRLNSILVVSCRLILVLKEILTFPPYDCEIQWIIMCRKCRLCSKYCMNSLPEVLHIKEECRLVGLYDLQLSDTYLPTCCSTATGTKRNSSRVGYDGCLSVKIHRSFRETCCLHTQALAEWVPCSYIKMEAKTSFETSVTIANWQGVTSQKIWILMCIGPCIILITEE